MHIYHQLVHKGVSWEHFRFDQQKKGFFVFFSVFNHSIVIIGCVVCVCLHNRGICAYHPTDIQLQLRRDFNQDRDYNHLAKNFNHKSHPEPFGCPTHPVRWQPASDWSVIFTPITPPNVRVCVPLGHLRWHLAKDSEMICQGPDLSTDTLIQDLYNCPNVYNRNVEELHMFAGHSVQPKAHVPVLAQNHWPARLSSM